MPEESSFAHGHGIRISGTTFPKTSSPEFWTCVRNEAREEETRRAASDRAAPQPIMNRWEKTRNKTAYASEIGATELSEDIRAFTGEESGREPDARIAVSSAEVWPNQRSADEFAEVVELPAQTQP